MLNLFIRKMKSILLCSFWLLLLVSIAFATPVDHQFSTVTEKTGEESQKEQTHNNIYKRQPGWLGFFRRFGSNADSSNAETPSTLSDIPVDVLISSILPKLSSEDAAEFRLAGRASNSMVKSRHKDFRNVVKACGKEIASNLIKQQWSADYQKNAEWSILKEDQVDVAHKCLWEVRKWVETLEEPQTIRVTFRLHNSEDEGRLFLDKELFQITQKVRFTTNIIVTYSKSDLKTLFQVVSQNECIHSLDLQNGNIGDDLAILLADILKNNTALQVLNLQGNDIGLKGAKALAAALTTNQGLLELDLGRNSFGREGMEALAEALKQNKKLQKLSLRSLQIDAVGTQAFAEVLRVNTALVSLDLGDNQIRNQGAIAIAGALKVSVPLQRLILDENSIRSGGLVALAGALETNQKLLYLNLKNNNFGTRGVLKIVSDLPKNTVLQELDLRTNGSFPFYGRMSRLLKEKKTQNGKPFILMID